MIKRIVNQSILCAGLIFILISGSNVSALEVSGTIESDTTWAVEDSPVIVTGSVLVLEAITLTIEPGVEVRLSPDRSIQIEGQLIARGTENNRISFVPQVENEPWGAIQFKDSAMDAVYDDNGNYVFGSAITFASFKLGGAPILDADSEMATLRLTAATPFISHIEVNDSQTNGIHGTNLGNNATLLNILDSRFIDSNRYAVYLSAGDFSGILNFNNNIVTGSAKNGNGAAGVRLHGFGKFYVSGNIISNVHELLYGGRYEGALYLTSGYISSVLYVENNTITGNSATGLFVKVNNSNGYIKNNIIVGNFGGIQNKGRTPLVANVVIDNLAAYDATAGYFSGIALGNRKSGSIVNNVIADNSDDANVGSHAISVAGQDVLTDIKILNNHIIRNESSSYVINLQTSSDGSSSYSTLFSSNTLSENIFSDSGNSEIHSLLKIFGGGYQTTITGNNFLHSSSSFILKNIVANRFFSLNANDNWWGTSNEEDIPNVIYDFTDDASVTPVSYSPALASINLEAPISPPSDVSAVISMGSINISWGENLESDVAGYKVYWGKKDAPFYENVIDVGNVTTHTIDNLPEGTYFVGVTAYDNFYDVAVDIPETITNDNMTNGNESWFTRRVANPLSISATDYNFGEVYLGAEALYTLTITNYGYTQYRVDSISLSDASFSVEKDDCSAVTLGPSERCDIVIQMLTDVQGEKTAVLNIAPSNSNHIPRSVSFQGTVLPTQDINLPTQALDFETVLLGQSKTLNLTVENPGTDALLISETTLSGPNALAFQVKNDCPSIGSASHCDLQITYTPGTANTQAEATLKIHSNDPDEAIVEVSLTGVAHAPISIGSLIVSTSTGVTPLDVDFTLAMTGGSGEYDFEWNFGDEKSATTQSPSHTFIEGNYAVSVTVKDRNNSENTSMGTLNIVSVSPTVPYSPVGITALSTDFGSGVAPFSPNFTANATGGSGEYVYRWGFSDGADGTGASATHRYETAGTYVVTLVVEDANDSSNRSFSQISVTSLSEPLGILSLSASQVVGVVDSFSPTFNLEIKGGSGSYQYQWDFGDNTTSTDISPTHSFDQAGNYLVNVLITDLNSSLTVSGNMQVAVIEKLPVYLPISIDHLSANFVAGITPLPIQFSILASGGFGTNYLYHWNLGDGETATGIDPTHTYQTAGLYDVIVTVEDANDSNNVAVGKIKVLVVDEPENISIALSYMLNSVSEDGVNVTVNAFMIGGKAPYEITWDFGDGSEKQVSTTASAVAEITHVYTLDGDYKITAVVKSQAGVGVMSKSVVSSLSVKTKNPASSASPEVSAESGSSAGAMNLWFCFLLASGFMLRRAKL